MLEEVIKIITVVILVATSIAAANTGDTYISVILAFIAGFVVRCK